MESPEERNGRGFAEAGGPPPPRPAEAGPAGQFHRPPDWRPDGSQVFDPRRRSPALACLLSLMPGLGQVYLGYYVRGFVHLAVAATTIAILDTGPPRGFEPLLGMFLAFFWLYNVIDAGRRAALINQYLRTGERPELPSEIDLPKPGGSILGGSILIVAGALLLARTRFDFSLAWLQDWWPAIPILAGLYLVLQGIRSRPAGSR